MVPSGGLQPHDRASRGLYRVGRRDGPRCKLPAGLFALPHGPLRRSCGVAPQGLRCGGCPDAERLLPPGRLLPACRRQGVGDEGLCHGFGRGARRHDCRRCAVQLRQAAVRVGRRCLQRGDQHADALHRPLSPLAARGRGADAAHCRLLQLARLRCGLPGHPFDALLGCRNPRRAAENHLFPGAGGL